MLPIMAAQQVLSPEAASKSDGTDAIVALHTRTVDALAGYEKMVEKAEPEFMATAESFRSLHQQHAEQIARILISHGRGADLDGSFMGSVNKAVVAMRAFFDEIDADVMTSIHNGEDHVLKAFDAALEHNLDAETDRELRGMRDELVALLDRTDDLDTKTSAT